MRRLGCCGLISLGYEIRCRHALVLHTVTLNCAVILTRGFTTTVYLARELIFISEQDYLIAIYVLRNRYFKAHMNHRICPQIWNVCFYYSSLWDSRSAVPSFFGVFPFSFELLPWTSTLVTQSTLPTSSNAVALFAQLLPILGYLNLIPQNEHLNKSSTIKLIPCNTKQQYSTRNTQKPQVPCTQNRMIQKITLPQTRFRRMLQLCLQRYDQSREPSAPQYTPP